MKATKTQIFFLILVMVFSGMLTLGNFINIPFIKNSKINLGLDLQGGTDILLQVDINDYIQNYKQNLVRDVKKSLFDDKIGYKNFQVNNENFSFEIRDAKDVKAAKKILHGIGVSFKHKDTVFYLDVSNTVLTEMKKKVLEQSIEVIRKRVDELGNKEISIYGVDDDKISLQIPGKNDPKTIEKLLNTQAKLTFHLMDDQPFVTNKSTDNPNIKVLEGEYVGYYYAIIKDIIIDGADLETASATITENGEAAVSFKFNNRAATVFGDITMQNIGRPFAIVLDGKVLSAPNIKEPILGGSGVISGSFTTKEANELALLLRAGALPAKIGIIKQESISATLGKESIILGIKSMFAGIFLVCLYMIIRYKVLGGIALFALIVNILCMFAFLSLFNSTLTLPGIAGIILTIGMAVDGNIIIFENIKSLQKKMQKKNVFLEAFAEAKPSIIDANITTILSAAMLYEFGFGPIKGFALTLIIGVIFSVFASLFVTKILISLLQKRFLV
jgi:preprotein translocase subunit SecD